MVMGGTRQFGRLDPYIHEAVKIPWGGNLPMGRSVKFHLPQNRAIFSYRPMRDSPPHEEITAPWDIYTTTTSCNSTSITAMLFSAWRRGQLLAIRW